MNYSEMSEEQKEKHKAGKRRRYKEKKMGVRGVYKPRMVGTVRKPGEVKKEKPKETKKQQRERFEREDREAKLLGISYGKYQMLKQQGKLPPIPEEVEVKPHGHILQEEVRKEKRAFNEFKEEQMRKMANEYAIAKAEREKMLKIGDDAALRYKKMIARQREAEKRG